MKLIDTSIDSSVNLTLDFLLQAICVCSDEKIDEIEKRITRMSYEHNHATGVIAAIVSIANKQKTVVANYRMQRSPSSTYVFSEHFERFNDDHRRLHEGGWFQLDKFTNDQDHLMMLDPDECFALDDEMNPVEDITEYFEANCK